MSVRSAINYLVYLVVRLFVAAVQAASPRVCEEAANVLSLLLTDVVPLRRKVMRQNLAIAYPELSSQQQRQLTRAMWRHLLLMVMEIAHTPRKIHRTTWRRHIDVPQVETIIRHLYRQRPAVIISGHYGNFELGGYLLGLFGFPTHTVARRLDNPYLDRFLNDFRSRTGQHMLPKQGSSEAIDHLLTSGGTLTLLGDQAAGEKGCWVSFFGHPASTHKAVALFSLSYAAPTLVIGVRRQQQMLQYTIDVAGEIDPGGDDFSLGGVQPMTEWYTRHLEQLIRHAPEQYWWVHRRWKGTPPKRALRQLARQESQRARQEKSHRTAKNHRTAEESA